MKVNPNFIIESCEDNKIFLSNRKSCKGYYIYLNEEQIACLTEQRIESLTTIGFYDEAIYKRPHLINKLISFRYPIKEQILLSITLWLMALGLIGTIISIWCAWPIIREMSALRIDKQTFIKATMIFIIGIILIHEMFHVISARLQNIEVFSISFKLKYYFIPICYVKIIPTGNDIKRANIAFAGNIADFFLIILYISIFITTKNPMWLVVLSLQSTMSLLNYNIFFPTDFYIGLFSILKKPNFRVQSVKFTKLVLTKKAKLKRKEHLIQLIYGISFYGILVFFIVMSALNVMLWIMRGGSE